MLMVCCVQRNIGVHYFQIKNGLVGHPAVSESLAVRKVHVVTPVQISRSSVFGCYGIFALEDWNSFVTKPFAVAEQEVQPLTGRLRR